MKKIIVTFAAIVMIAGFSNRVFAQGVISQTAPTPAAATISVGLTVTNPTESKLDFGTIASSAALGTVELAFNGNRTDVGGVTSLSAGVGHVPTLVVAGNPNNLFTVTFSDFSVVGPTGSTPMLVNSLVSTYGASGLGGTLDGTGAANFQIRGILHVNANQATGLYTKNFDVTVAYQ